MQTTPKANNILGHLCALFGLLVMLAIATWVSASSSEQVKPLDNLATPRTGHTATALNDGRILITGGRDADGHLVADSEIFDPESQTSSTSATLHTARVDHTATVLTDGRVLVIGGTGDSGALSSAEIFDPAHPESGFATVGSAMSTARAKHTATLLNSGLVLIAGGDAQGTAELFDPATGTFMPTIWPLTVARSGHTATLFTDDTVLLAGGNTSSMETFTPNQGFTLDPATMSVMRTGHWAFELSDTRLLLFQGDTGNTIDEFNPSTGTITPKGSLDFHASSSSLLANGKVLVLGTEVSGLYDPNAVPPAPDFTAFDENTVPNSGALPRSGQAAVELPGDKKILISGGVDADNHLLGQALYNPAKIWTDKDDYQPEEPVVLSASGWQANEPIYLFAVDNETEEWTYEMTVNTDSNGEFILSPYFIVELRHLGVQFHVTAVGQSTMQADVYFTDSNPQTVTVGSQSPNPVIRGNSATYTVSLIVGGNTTPCSVTLSASGLPSGATASFTPNPVVTTGSGGSPYTSTMTVSTTTGVTAGTYNFTVNGTNGAGCQGQGPVPSPSPFNATLIVAGKNTPTINWSNPADITYGTALSGTQLNATATFNGNPVPGTFAYTPAAGTVLHAGNAQTLHVDFTPTDTSNFNNASKDVQINVLRRAVTVTPDAGQFKVYGNADPVLTYSITSGSLVSGDSFSGALSRDPGENVGLFNITQGTLALSTNYNLTFTTGVKFEIKARAVTVTPDSGQFKIYGNADPVLTYSITSGSLVTGDNFSGALSRDAGENVGLYNITQGTLALSTNYNLTFTTGVKFEIKARAITVTPDSGQFKIYGNADPVFTYSITSGSLVGTDSFSGALSRDTGENVGLYDITQGTLALSSNYELTFTIGVKFEIKKRPVTVTPDSGQHKTYGEADPVFTYSITSGSLVGTDSFSGAVSRDAGEDVGLYEITEGSLTLGSNYDLTVTAGVKFEIKKRAVTVTPDSGQFKIYGNADPTLTYSITSGSLVGTDSFSGALSRDGGENVGLYEITQGSLTLGSNYDLTVTAGVNFEIKKRPIEVTATAEQFKIYGNSDPVFAYTVTSGSLAFTDSFTGALSRVAGENVGLYAITIGTLAISDGNSGNNYTLTFVSNNFEIKKRPIEVTATTGQFKIYGEADPVFAYTVTSGSLAYSDSFTGALSRVSGQNVGLYAITIGTLAISDGNSGNNYMLSFVSNNFEIIKRPATWTTNAANKIYGESDPAFTGSGEAQGVGTGFLTADNVTATYSRAAGENASPPTYHISATLAPAGVLSNYLITNNGAEFTINKRPATWTTNPASKFFGASDPNPLTTGSGQAQGVGIGFLTADNVTATYSRVAGEAVSPPTYHITATLSATPASALNNYTITNPGAEFSINGWTITGFYQPVDMNGVVNTVKGGSTVPLKFNIYAGNVEKTSVSDVMYQTCQVIEFNCVNGLPEDQIEEVVNTGSTNLRYDTTGHQFIQNWKTPSTKNKCYIVRMTAIDGSIIEARFKTK